MSPMKRGLSIGLAIGMAFLTGSPVQGARPTGPTDITATAAGEKIASDAAMRWTNAGIPTSASDVIVLDLGADGMLVAPRNATGLAGGVELRADGSVITSGAALAAPDGSGSGSLNSSMTNTEATTAAVPTWGFWSGSCFSRLNTSAGWMDTCTSFYKLFNDVDGGYDYWDLHLYSSAYAYNNLGYYLTQSYVRSLRSGGATQYWVDWSLKSVHDTGCQQDSLSVSALGFGLGFGHTFCEKWSPYKYADAGHMNDTWTKGFFAPTGMRENALTVVVKVPQGGIPSYSIGYSFGTAHI
ncbi:MAG: hypothetical protein H0W81_02135 [Chloroflexi bacterium]|nr:hypothetical protein [Chloroflexota bacterium]